MDIAAWRRKLDQLDRRLVRMLNQRARAAQEIGRLKARTAMPIYEPKREQAVFANVRRANRGPFPDHELKRVFEEIIGVMRRLQRKEILVRRKPKRRRRK
ncbi:MAG TPA: chorismate mutase [Terriglobales bacterium]|nr:chorismate mutase [Terriglobales bacterium]